MRIDSVEVRRIARLASLELDEAVVEPFREQLGSILDYVARLDELDVEHVPPTSHTGHDPPALREDRERRCVSAAEALRNAPDSADDLFRVPQVLPPTGRTREGDG